MALEGRADAERIDSLEVVVEELRDDVDKLASRVDASDDRSVDVDELIARVDASQVRADVAEDRADAVHEKLEGLLTDSALDREILAELHADGEVAREQVAQLKQALASSRVIGAAVGLLMASRNVSQDEAIELLKAASSRSNTPLRKLAEVIVAGPPEDA